MKKSKSGSGSSSSSDSEVEEGQHRSNRFFYYLDLFSVVRFPPPPVLRIRICWIRKILASWIRICKIMRIQGEKYLPKTAKRNFFASKPKSKLSKKERL